MKKVELHKGIHSSVIGFGCAPIMGSVDKKKAKYALDKAFELGINHLDLARSYGYGDAEEFVGEIFKDRKKEVVLASKFGIKANWMASVLKKFKPVVRLYQESKAKSHSELKSNTTRKTNANNKISDIFLERARPLRSSDMIKSLDKSLNKLGREYLDYFFIHEPLQTLDYADELLETAQNLKNQGKIRAFGLSYMHSQKHLHEKYIDRFDLLQFNNPLGENSYKDFRGRRGNRANIIFSPFNGGPQEMTPTQKLEKLLTDFSQSVILCSMFNEDHLKENVRLVERVSTN